jgi:hypothetical protein
VHDQLESRRLQLDVIIVTIDLVETKDGRIKGGDPIDVLREKHRACS